MSSDLLTAGQVADRLGVHRTTVHHWVHAGKLTPQAEANGIRLFARADVERFAAQRETVG
jgi:excisionase family DNA binding protein